MIIQLFFFFKTGFLSPSPYFFNFFLSFSFFNHLSFIIIILFYNYFHYLFILHFKTKSEREPVKNKTNKQKNSLQTKARIKGLHLENIKHIKNWYLSLSLSNHWRAGVTPKVIPWIYYHSDIKTRQRHYQKKKLQANIFDEYRWKNS